MLDCWNSLELCSASHSVAEFDCVRRGPLYTPAQVPPSYRVLSHHGHANIFLVMTNLVDADSIDLDEAIRVTISMNLLQNIFTVLESVP